LNADPVRRAVNSIGATIAAGLGNKDGDAAAIRKV
jgi:hypothetical protein